MSRNSILMTICAAFLLLWLVSIKSTSLTFTPPQGTTVVLGNGGVYVVSPLLDVPFSSLQLNYPVSSGWIQGPKLFQGTVLGSGSEFPMPNVKSMWLPIFPWFLISVAMLICFRKRIPRNHCGGCGYDLTGNVTGVCSECGKS